MIKVILFDCDGPIIKREMYFSERMLKERGVNTDLEKQKVFFTGEFLLCETGKADLKEVLPKWLDTWKWQGNTDELLDYWFSNEAAVDREMVDYIQTLRKVGISCYLSTNQEKHRASYVWNKLGLKNFLDGIFASCELGYMKPELEFWAEINKSLGGVDRQEVLVLDDERETVASAQKFGFNAEFYTDFENFRKVMKETYHL